MTPIFCKQPVKLYILSLTKLIEYETEQNNSKDLPYLEDNTQEMPMTVAEQEIDEVKDTSIVDVVKGKQKEFEQMMSMETPDQILTDTGENNLRDNYKYFINVKDKPVIVDKKNSAKQSLMEDNNIPKGTTEEDVSVESSEKVIAKPVDETNTNSINVYTLKRDHHSDDIR